MEKTEVWKDIPEYKRLYQVSNWGRVKSLNYNNTGKEGILKPCKNKYGYMKVGLYKNGVGKTHNIHRLVALAFIPNDYNLPCINHKDENKQNNKVENLEWCTVKQNTNYGTSIERASEAKKIPIIQYTLDGEFIRIWDSITQAEQELNLSHISDCCKNKRNKCGGYIWRYK
jgi:hypothetical protein